jgi:hypothetical protein
VNIVRLETRMNGAFLWLSLLTVASGIVALIFFSNFASVEKEIGSVNQAVAVQSATLNGMQGSLNRIEDKLDSQNGNNAQTGSGAGQAGGVSGGKTGGGKPNG